MNKLDKLKIKFNEYMRVLRVTKKPDSYEFKTIVKVTGIGILIIGILGFLIQNIKYLFGF
ncbi:MAG: protein translocase SEC61 complex subunit gamma [Nanoarchaeota archaeon]